MSAREETIYLRGRWPDEEIPPGEPEEVLYEVSYARDAALRSIEIFGDGTIARNSIELEQRKGDDCPSIFDRSLEISLADASVIQISRDDFEALWDKGIDTPFWFPD